MSPLYGWRGDSIDTVPKCQPEANHDLASSTVNFVQYQQYTDTRCEYGHDEYVVHDLLNADGVEQYVAQPRWRSGEAGCSDNEAVKAKEQQQ